MTESSTFRLAELSPRRYRWAADRATKLAGVGLIAVGLDAGGGIAWASRSRRSASRSASRPFSEKQ